MTSKERMLIAMKNGQADMVPVAPDISNMIPCRLTGKPFWDIYLYRNPPLWKAYIDAVNYFGFDGWLVEGVPAVPDPKPVAVNTEKSAIIFRSDEKIVTRKYAEENGGKKWSPLVTVYYHDNPPTTLSASKVGLEGPPEQYEIVENKNIESLREIKEYLGDKGVVGMSACPPTLGNPETPGVYSIYDYHDRYKEVKEWAVNFGEATLQRLEKILNAPEKPDFILTGGSGLLIFNTPKTFRDLGLPTLKKITEMCRKAGIPSQIHCCGPEKELVKICAEETDLDSINPLETPPMGDCYLRNIKKQFGSRLSLMGNLHTTEIMLKGSVQDVNEAAKRAMDDAAEGGGFILSTGDQCGRDTPDENLFSLIEVARTYGKY